jgi:phage tail P2-like protein
MVNLDDLELLQILPPSISGDKNVRAVAKALDPELQSVSRDTREALIVSRIDELPEPVLDLLAWQWHVDFYELARTLEMKRAAVRGSIPWHRQKGTKWAIKKALEMIGVDAELTEWWNIEGASPYTFALTAKITDEYWLKNENWEETTQTIRRAVEESKAARSWLLSFTAQIERELSETLFHAIIPARGTFHCIGLSSPEYAPSSLSTGVGTGMAGSVRITPARPDFSPSALYFGARSTAAVFLRVEPADGELPEIPNWRPPSIVGKIEATANIRQYSAIAASVMAKIEIGSAPSRVAEETTAQHCAGIAATHGYHVIIGPATGQSAVMD